MHKPAVETRTRLLPAIPDYGTYFKRLGPTIFDFGRLKFWTSMFSKIFGSVILEHEKPTKQTIA